MAFAWTDERIEQLRVMWADNHSASKIGAEFGITRNAVIGKARRIGLSRKEHRAEQQQTRIHHERRRTAIRVKRLAARLDAPIMPEPPAPIDDAEIPVEQRRQLLDLESHHCRWPVGEVGDPGFFFCGADGADMTNGRPYCPAHAERAKGDGRVFRSMPATQTFVIRRVGKSAAEVLGHLDVMEASS